MKKSIQVLFVCILSLSFAAVADPVEITAFESSGQVAWTNIANTASWYRVEWSADLDSGKWQRSGQAMNTIQGGTNESFTAQVPMHYRIVMETNPPPQGMALVDGGPFLMGDHSGSGLIYERPVHEVYVSPFYIDRHEVSLEQMRQVMQWAYDAGMVTVVVDMVRSVTVSPTDLLELGDDTFHGLNFETGTFYVVEYPAYKEEGHYPAANMTWYGAMAYCHFRSLMEGVESGINYKSFSCNFNDPGYRLPTEAEWEKAARGGLTGNHYPWPSKDGTYNSNIDKGKCSYDGTSPKRRCFYNGAQSPDEGPDMANGFGLYDMAGNVGEWCYDWYSNSWYDDPKSTNDNTTGPSIATSFRVIRGGYSSSSAFDVRCSARAGSVLSGGYVVGFRCVRRP